MPKQSGFQVTHNIRWGSRTSKSEASMLIRDKCAKCKEKLDAARERNKKLAQRNKQLVQALEAAKAEIVELKEAASRQLKIDSLYLPRLKSWLDAQRCSMSALMKDCARSTRLLEDIMTPGADLTLTAEDSLQDEAAAPQPRPSLHPPGSRYCDECRMSTVLEEDENDKTEDMELWRDSTGQLEEVQPEVTQFSGVTLRRRHHSGRRCSLPVMFRDLLDEPLDAPAFAVLDEGASSLLDEITGQENSIVRAETGLMPPPEKPKGHSADEYSVAFSHRPKIPRTPCRTEGHDGDAGLAPSSDDACSSPKQRQQMQPRRGSGTPLLPWPRKPVAPQGSPKERVMKEFGAEVTNTLLLSPQRSVQSPSSTQLPKGTTPSQESVGDCWDDENGPPLAKIRRRQSANKSRAANGTKPKASRLTFVVKKRRGSVMHEDGAVGPMDDAASLPDPSVDGRWEEGCEDRPQRVDGAPQRQHPAAVNVLDPSVVRHRASLPKKQRGATEKRGKPRGKKSEGKKTADIEEEPASQPSAPAPYPVQKPPEGGNHRPKKSQGKKKTADTEEPAPHLATPAPNPTDRQPAGGKPRAKKLHCEEQAPQPAVSAFLPPPSRCAQHNGCTPPLSEPLGAVPTSSDNDSRSQCMPSGRPARAATKCASYKFASLSQKRRRP